MQNDAKAYIRTRYEKSFGRSRVTIWKPSACAILLSGVFPAVEKQRIKTHITLTVSQLAPMCPNPLFA
jgi:hypothetical protein